jgi:hypothetical protein
MSKPFDMEFFLKGALTGSHASRQRHIRQAKTIQAAINDRWHLNNPWYWQQKHLTWILNKHLNKKAQSTRYYYFLTARLIILRLGKSWPLYIK